MTGFGIVAGVVALFFAAGILTGVLGVMALSAMRDHRGRGARRRYAARRAEQHSTGTGHGGQPVLTGKTGPAGKDSYAPDEIGEPPPPWPGGRRDLAARSD